MKIVLKNTSILDSASSFFGAKKDICIENGKIVSIEDNIALTDDVQIIESSNLCISQSWVDLDADFCDPGTETRENLHSGRKVAQAGGFGHVYLSPSTSPVTDNKAQVIYLQSENNKLGVQLHSIGAITKKIEGDDLAEMFDMYNAGVQFFSDGTNFTSIPILYRALLYAKNFGGTIVSFPQEPSFSLHGQINEGFSSVKTGLKGIPSVGEEIIVQRDIQLAAYTNSSLHINGVSSAKSVQLIREAKKKGIKLSCTVFAHHLLFNEDAVATFDTNHKVFPPYRRETDRKALWEGLKDDTIDCIVSHHQPQAVEAKDIAFDHAAFGAISLQTLYATLNEANETLHQKLIDKISVFPRKLTKLDLKTSIEIGNRAECTFFDPTIKWKFDQNTNHSKSSNSPFLGQNLKGKPLGIIHGNTLLTNS